MIDEIDEERVTAVLRSDSWSKGPNTQAFESSFARYCGVKHCLLVGNGTAALKLALRGAGVERGDEIIIPGITWPSVALAILECRATAVLVDIDLDTFGMSTKAFEAAITPRTKAVIPTHLFCSQTDLPPLIRLASSRNIQVIEDCAHVPGCRRFGKTLGTFGLAGIFSFNNKKLLTCGEGGCLITNDTELFERAYALREVNPGVFTSASLPSVLLASEFQAAVLTSQLEKLPASLELMENRAELLRSLLGATDRVYPLARLPGTDVQAFYNFCFRVSGISDIGLFRRALAAELNLPMFGAYPPLSETPILGTTNQSKRADLSNCVRVHCHEAVRFRHNALRADEDAMRDIANAVAKVIVTFDKRRL